MITLYIYIYKTHNVATAAITACGGSTHGTAIAVPWNDWLGGFFDIKGRDMTTVKICGVPYTMTREEDWLPR